MGERCDLTWECIKLIHSAPTVSFCFGDVSTYYCEWNAFLPLLVGKRPDLNLWYQVFGYFFSELKLFYQIRTNQFVTQRMTGRKAIWFCWLCAGKMLILIFSLYLEYLAIFAVKPNEPEIINLLAELRVKIVVRWCWKLRNYMICRDWRRVERRFFSRDRRWCVSPAKEAHNAEMSCWLLNGKSFLDCWNLSNG